MLSFIYSLLKSLNDLGLVTLIVGILAYIIYILQRKDAKRDTAKIILQEIRRAEDIISDYKENGEYKFTKKIIATNSWAKSIHYFVGDLDIDELDKISNLYSMGEYLDSIIGKISDAKFERSLKETDDEVEKLKKTSDSPVNPAVSQLIIPSSNPNVPNKPPQSIIVTKQPNILKQPVLIGIQAPWKPLLDEITNKYEPIYHSTTVDRLKIIARLK